MKALTTHDLDRVLKQNAVTKRYYLGAYPSCIRPKRMKKAYAFISNGQTHEQGGDHWFAWFVEEDKISFFDSFGRDLKDPTLPNEFDDILKNFRIISYSSIQLQGWDSKSCGQFCIHFIYSKSLGLDFNTFLSEYTHNFNKNEKIVSSFFSSII